ncbi:ParB/Srx family N-terminal domain-containing protein [Ralstonia insidiosa]|uniref:ParB/Srx family N-terminal domain-containing protein n=1 Tax=Ralstonia insidiosa TaxID=190721 RepID=UPI00205065EC|nr:ParB/Srx family N-terminal domain-containing protein [Ralstonia insidiosa]MDE4924355.1 ParB/Srx family N-terminal domain-containing protein [Ralstonia insidiosa]UNJ99898.1 ParB/Srx family N-terminal domain-containing protein [Ralstonia insidiosa]
MTDAKMARAIEVWPISRLKPYKKNARTHSPEQIDKIAASIVEFGFNNPILVDESDGIVAGHGRLLALEKLGWTECPVIALTHMTPEQRRAYVIADNQLATLAGWDQDMLASELADLEDEGFDLSLIGFSDKELEELLGEDGGDGEGQGEGEGPGDPEELVAVTVQMTAPQRDRLNLLGGDLWIRRQIDGAR